MTVADNEKSVAESRLAQARAEVRRREAEANGRGDRAAARHHHRSRGGLGHGARGTDRRRAAPRRARPRVHGGVAPVRGVVARKSVEVGEYVRPGQAVLAVVVLDDVWVVANFKETQVTPMRPGHARASRSTPTPGASTKARRVDRRRHQLELQPAAAGERERQLRQGGAAPAGQDRVRGPQDAATVASRHVVIARVYTKSEVARPRPTPRPRPRPGPTPPRRFHDPRRRGPVSDSAILPLAEPNRWVVAGA